MEIFLWISKPSEMDVEPYYNRMGLDGWVSLDTGIVDIEHHSVLLAKEKEYPYLIFVIFGTPP